MKEFAVEVNDILQIKIVDDPNSLSYRSRVEDIVGDWMIIGWPTSNGVLVPIHLNRPLSLSFVREDAAYLFVGVVQEREREPFPHLKVHLLGPRERLQRRQFFRVRVPIWLEIKGARSFRENPDAVLYLKTHTYDLSGSGVAIRSETSIPVGTILEAKLLLDQLPPLKATAKVVSSESIVTPDRKTLSHIGMSFVELKESQRTRLVCYVFRVQRQELARFHENTPGVDKGAGKVFPFSTANEPGRE